MERRARGRHQTAAMGQSADNWSLLWALAVWNMVPLFVARTSRRRTSASASPAYRIPDMLAYWMLYLGFAVAWILSFVSMWLWGRNRDGRYGNMFDAVNSLYMVTTVLHAAWIGAVVEHGIRTVAAAVFAVFAWAAAVAVFACQIVAGTKEHSDDVWGAFGTWVFVVLWLTVLAFYTVGQACRTGDRAAEDDEAELITDEADSLQDSIVKAASGPTKNRRFRRGLISSHV